MTQVVAALIWDGPRFLACQRPAHKARGLMWEFVGGKVEPGETLRQALVRECREELAITVRPGEIFMELDHVYPDLTIHLTLFHAVIEEGEPQLLEHAAMRWITTDELDDLPFCPADAEILKALKARFPTVQARLFAMQDLPYRDFQAPLLPTVDMVLVMSVNPGFGGQKFIPETPEKIRTILRLAEAHGAHPLIEVDGGISKETAGLVASAGARLLVAGSAVFKAEDRHKAMTEIAQAAQAGLGRKA